MSYMRMSCAESREKRYLSDKRFYTLVNLICVELIEKRFNVYDIEDAVKLAVRMWEKEQIKELGREAEDE